MKLSSSRFKASKWSIFACSG